MSKTKYIIFALLIAGVVSLLTYLNYDKIKLYLINREWEIADSLGKIEIENYIDTLGTNSGLFVVTSGAIQGYADNTKKIMEKPISMKETVSDVAGDYAIIAEKNATDLYVISRNEVAWNTSINNGSILSVSINKNGYSAIIYSQAGYKSLIKVFSNTGKELFTSYLASTYAIDVSISNDNRTLAVAEIDTSGISLVSRIKLIEIQAASESNIQKYDLEKDELISQIEYNKNNQLIIMTDIGIKELKNNTVTEIINFKNEKIIMANIDDANNIVTAKIKEERLFSVKCAISIYQSDTLNIEKTYELEETPNQIVSWENMIAIDTGNKILFLNSMRKYGQKV